MAKPKREYILATFFLAGIGSALLFVALGTPDWINADGKFIDSTITTTSTINYGLFTGTYERKLEGNTFFFEIISKWYSYIMQFMIIFGEKFVLMKGFIAATCNFGSNACLMLCSSTSEGRQKQLQEFLDKQPVKFDEFCPQVSRAFQAPQIRSNPGQGLFNFYLYSTMLVCSAP